MTKAFEIKQCSLCVQKGPIFQANNVCCVVRLARDAPSAAGAQSYLDLARRNGMSPEDLETVRQVTLLLRPEWGGKEWAANDED